MTNEGQISVPKVAPFRIDPVFVARVWGYRDLRPWFDRVAEGEPIGEVWLTGDMCVAASGPHAGKRLDALFDEAPESMLGAAAPSPESPLLVKVIFAAEKLSVQVHPDDAMARRYGQPRGKTECWYALAAEPGAQVAVGVKPGTTLEKVKEGMQAGTLEESLTALPIAAGELIYVDAGTVHAIWPGSILLETQQNCDLTYRMFDYGRGRELHFEKGIEATKLTTRAGKVEPRVLADRVILADAEYFRLERILMTGSLSSENLRVGQDAGLAYLFAASGAGRIVAAGSNVGFAPIELPARGIVAVPASSPAFTVENAGGENSPLELIRITPRWTGGAGA